MTAAWNCIHLTLETVRDKIKSVSCILYTCADSCGERKLTYLSTEPYLIVVLPLSASDISAVTVYCYVSSQKIGPLSGATSYKVQLTPKN